MNNRATIPAPLVEVMIASSIEQSEGILTSLIEKEMPDAAFTITRRFNSSTTEAQTVYNIFAPYRNVHINGNDINQVCSAFVTEVIRQDFKKGKRE